MEKSRNIALYLHAEGIARRSGVGVGVCFIHKNGAMIRLSVDVLKRRKFWILQSIGKVEIDATGRYIPPEGVLWAFMLVVHQEENIYTYQRGCLSVSVNCKRFFLRPRNVDSQRMTPRFFCV
ncbi:MAG: hypothetical protein MJZ15_01345 [Bacteroidales bacterium]|nr:hypothetical protein [Bacteroidales bacterium]